MGRPGENGGESAMLEAGRDEVLPLIDAQVTAALGKDNVGPQAVMVTQQQSSRHRDACFHPLRAQVAFERTVGTDHRPSRRPRRPSYLLHGGQRRHLVPVKRALGDELLGARFQQPTKTSKAVQQDLCLLQLGASDRHLLPTLEPPIRPRLQSFPSQAERPMTDTP
jgi:hypothetical protein